MIQFKDFKQMNKSSIYGLVVSTILFFMMSGCKENTILPPDLVPTIDNINTFDSTFSLLTNNIVQDSLLTGGVLNGARVSSSTTFYHALGSISGDAVFGKTNASFHVEVLPATTNFQFKTDSTGTTRTIDSIVLSIPFVSSWGDTTNNVSQTFNVYRSIKTFSRDSAQYDFTRDSADFTHLIASQTVNFTTFKTDSPLVGTVKQQPQLRFKLASWFSDSLQTQVDLGANGAAADFSKFLTWWKGFYITPADSNSGSTIGYFNNYKTRLIIYYRYTKTTGGQDTTSSVFSFDPNYCNRFNTIIRRRSGSIAANFVGSILNPLGDSVLFAQGEPGLAAQIRIPTLKNFPNSIINKAELTFTAISPFESWSDTIQYGGLNPRLQILKTDTAGNDLFVEEYSTFGSGFVDGKRSTYSEAGINYTQYKFVITNTIQKIISQNDTTFRLKIMGTNIGLPGAYRSVLRGSNSSNNLVPKLYMIYTKIK